jgi:hypothetical protein
MRQRFDIGTRQYGLLPTFISNSQLLGMHQSHLQNDDQQQRGEHRVPAACDRWPPIEILTSAIKPLIRTESIRPTS